MNKQEFLDRLRKGLAGLPRDEIEERLTFYADMIEDRMEEGLSEEEAVSAAGSIKEIIAQLMPDTSAVQKQTPAKKPLNPWIIVLLVLGAPIWLSLAISATAIIFSLYVSLWSVIVSLWAVFGSLIGCAVGIAAGGIVLICKAHLLAGIAMIGAGFICGGISIFMFCGCKAATKGILTLTKRFPVWIKNCFAKKEVTQ